MIVALPIGVVMLALAWLLITQVLYRASPRSPSIGQWCSASASAWGP